MKRRHILVVVALVLLIALSILPWTGQTTANADDGCAVFGATSADYAQTGGMGDLVNGVATTGPNAASDIILWEHTFMCQ